MSSVKLVMSSVKLEITKRINYTEIESHRPKEIQVDGKTVKLCVNCGKPITREQNDKYCSRECCDIYYATHNQAGLRDYVYARENGTCQKCGWKNKPYPVPEPRWTPEFSEPEPKRPGWFEGENGKSLHRKAMIAYNKEYKEWKVRHDAWLGTPEYREAEQKLSREHSLWSIEHSKWLESWRNFIADHIVPIALGGPEFDLTNVQLLCEVCNKKKTAKDAADIAKFRKQVKRVNGCASLDNFASLHAHYSDNPKA